MRILVTGAGLVGAHAAALLASRDHTVTLCDVAPNEPYVRGVVGGGMTRVSLETGDVTDLSAFAPHVEGHDAVVHTAGLIGPRAQERPFVGFIVNVVGTVNVAEASRLAGASRLIYASTHGVYDFASATAPMTEDAPTVARGVYSATKLAAEHMLEAYSDAHGLAVVALRFANLFGRGTYVGGSRGGAAFDELVRAPLRREVARILPAVAGRSEWLYAKDAARAIVAAVERPELGRFTVVNIGSGRLSGPDDIVAAIRAVVPEAEFARAGEPGRERRQPFDLTAAKHLLGWAPSYTLAAAVADYVADIRAGQASP